MRVVVIFLCLLIPALAFSPAPEPQVLARPEIEPGKAEPVIRAFEPAARTVERSVPVAEPIAQVLAFLKAPPVEAPMPRSHVFAGPSGEIEASLSEDGDRLALAVTVRPSLGDGALRTGARLLEGQRFAMQLSSIPGVQSFDVFQAVREGNVVVLRVGTGGTVDEVRLGLAL